MVARHRDRHCRRAYLLVRVRVWFGALLGALCLVLPHLIGAPALPVGAIGPVPAELVHAFGEARSRR